MTYEEIGIILNKHHASIIHYMKMMNFDLEVLGGHFKDRIKNIIGELTFKPIERDNKDFVKQVMDCIVWDEKGTTRINLERLIA